MGFIDTQENDGVATLTLSRGKVNALNGEVVDELRTTLEALERNPEVRAVVLTATGAFFSFGFDVPEFLAYSKEQFTDYATRFTALYTYMFAYPKPIVAAINGHAVAGGCMLALACDYRVMASGKAKISLNEIRFGSSVFAGSVEMLRFWVGSATATEVLVSGDMYTAEEAQSLGLVEDVAVDDALLDMAGEIAGELGSKYPAAFAGIKSLLRASIVDDMRRREADSIRRFVETWYSEATRSNLRNIRIL